MISLDFNERIIAYLDGGVLQQPQFSTVYGEISKQTQQFIGATSSEGLLNNLFPTEMVPPPDDTSIIRRHLKSLQIYFPDVTSRRLTIEKENVLTSQSITLFSAVLSQGFSINYDGSFKVLTDLGALITSNVTTTNTVITGNAQDITFDPSGTTMTSVNVQEALEETSSILNDIEDFNIDKSISYDIDGRLSTITTAKGTKTFNYIDGILASIIGTGAYKSKTFNYTGDKLTSVDVT